MKLSQFTVATLALGLIAGCANMSETSTPTPEGLQDKVAGNLGFKPGDVKISDIRGGTSITYFLATTPKGTYGCSIPSGGLVSFATLGVVTIPPTCNKQ